MTLPSLQPVGNAVSGLLAGALDPVLNTIITGVNTNITVPLSGQNIGVTALDQNGNIVSVPGNCNLGVDGLTVSANKGITLGGGRVDGLGGPANPPALAGDVNSIALGNGASTSALAGNAAAIGLRSSVTATDGVAIGRDAAASAQGGVALGAGSVADRAGLAGAAEMFSGMPVTSANGAVSVGAAGGERQITNVAGGTQATDAVNVRQLRAVGQDLAGALGGGTGFDANGAFTGPSYRIRGSIYADVGSALNALDTVSNVSNVPVAANNTTGYALPTAMGGDSVALGYGGSAAGDRSAAFGTQASAGGSGSTALGSGANAAGDGSTAVGQNASAGQAGSTAIGAGARTTRANQVTVGTASSTYTLSGLGSAASLAAQSGPTRLVTTDASGNLATSDFDPRGLTDRVSSLERFGIEARREARQGIAAAMSMAAAPLPSAPGRTTWTANTATFKGEWAGGFAVAHRLDLPVPLAVTATYAGTAGNNHGVRFGLAGEF